jgi:predicted component of type VI protein secretion system
MQMLQAKLIVVGGEVKTKEVNLRLPAVIGRGREATLTLPHALVSRAHCEVFERNGRLFVRDLDSLNGTYVNNYKIQGDQPLMPGELLTIGTVTFRADYQIGTEADPAIPPFTTAAHKTREITKPQSAETDAVRLLEDEPRDKWLDTTVAGRPPTLPASVPVPTQPDNQGVLPGQLAAIEASAGGSNVLNELDLGTAPNKSISWSAIDQLPGRINQASFIDGFGDNQTAAVSDSLVCLKIEADDKPGANGKPIDDDSHLDSFIKKLPK